MSKKALLLNQNYEIIGFISERKIYKFLFSNKTEIISTWNEDICWGSGKTKLPSILKLTYPIKRYIPTQTFSRKALVKRDKNCQYCFKKLSPSEVTIDHIIPKSLGGKNSFTNCVIACRACNNKKGDRTLEQSGMVLLRKPMHPSFNPAHAIYEPNDCWHTDWDIYLSKY